MNKPVLNVELTNLIPVRAIVGYGFEKVLELARNLKNSGSDIVVENDLADIFGRGIIEPQLRAKFQDAVLRHVNIVPLYPGSQLALAYGAGPTVDYAIKSPDQAYMASVIQLSLLSAFHHRSELASALAECMAQRALHGYPGSRLNPDQGGIEATLSAISAQTDAYHWGALVDLVESQLHRAHPEYQLVPYNRQDLLHLTPTVLLAAMDMLYTIQRLPEHRTMQVTGQRGLIVLVIWAHYLLSLNVTVTGLRNGNLTFGSSSLVHIYIEWKPFRTVVPVDDSKVLLLDSNEEILFKAEPSILRMGTITSDERHTIRNFGTRWLQTRFNNFYSFADNDTVYPGVVNYLTAMACSASTKLFRGPPDPRSSMGARSFDQTSSPMIERWRVESAAKLIFQDIGLDAKEINSSYSKGSHFSALEDFPQPRRLRACIDDTLMGPVFFSSLKLDALAIFIIMVAFLSNLEESAEAPLLLNLDDIAASDLARGLWRANDSTGAAGHLHHSTLFELFAEMLMGSNADYVDARAFVVSDRGWSLILDAVGDKDPADVHPARLHLRRGVPTSSTTGAIKYLVMDMDRHPDIAVVPGLAIYDRGQSFVPRCVTHIHQRREYVTSFRNAFLVKLEFEGKEDVEDGMIRYFTPQSFDHSRRNLIESGFIRVISGSRALHDALWQVTFTQPCQHLGAKDVLQLDSDCATTNALDWKEEGETEARPPVPERICVVLVKGDGRSRCLAVQEAVQNEMRQVILRQKGTCEDCAISLAASLPGPWLVII